VGDDCWIKKLFLGQQPPCARAHACTTTTRATTHGTEIEAIRHSNSILSGLASNSQSTYVTLSIHILHAENQNFCAHTESEAHSA